jgi:hypothetical protein
MTLSPNKFKCWLFLKPRKGKLVTFGIVAHIIPDITPATVSKHFLADKPRPDVNIWAIQTKPAKTD